MDLARRGNTIQKERSSDTRAVTYEHSSIRVSTDEFGAGADEVVTDLRAGQTYSSARRAALAQEGDLAHLDAVAIQRRAFGVMAFKAAA